MIKGSPGETDHTPQIGSRGPSMVTSCFLYFAGVGVAGGGLVRHPADEVDRPEVGIEVREDDPASEEIRYAGPGAAVLAGPLPGHHQAGPDDLVPGVSPVHEM
jgi:hypothetical protein